MPNRAQALRLTIPAVWSARRLRKEPADRDEERKPDEAAELPGELLDQARSTVLARLGEYGQGPLLIRRNRR